MFKNFTFVKHVPKTPTRKDSDRIIDYAISTNINKVIQTKKIFYEISDHFPIQFKIEHFFSLKTETPKVFNRTLLENSKKCDEIKNDPIWLLNDNIEDTTQKITSKYNLFKPKIAFENKLRLSRKSRRLITQKRQLNKQLFKKHQKINMSNYQIIKTRLKQSLKKDKEKNKKKISYKIQNSKKALESPKMMWRFLNNKGLITKLPTLNVHTKNLTLPAKTIEEANENYFVHFKTLALNSNYNPACYNIKTPDSQNEKLEITFQDFCEATKKCKKRKAA